MYQYRRLSNDNLIHEQIAPPERPASPLDEVEDHDNEHQKPTPTTFGDLGHSSQTSVDQSFQAVPPPVVSSSPNRTPSASHLKSDFQGEGKDVKNNRTVNNPWTPGILARFPWVGLGALVGIVCLTGAAVVVLAVSNRSPINHWEVGEVMIQPQVWVSVLSTIMDALTVLALAEGTTIYFWRQAGRGTTLRKLHDYYESKALLGALKGSVRGRINGVVFACLLAAISALRGPLLQRASTVNDKASYSRTGQMPLKMAQAIPPGYFYPDIWNSGFHDVWDNYIERTPISFQYGDCGTSCSTALKGFGFGINCSASKIPWDSIGDYYQAEFQGDIPVWNVTDLITDSFPDDPSPSTDPLEATELASLDRLEIAILFKQEPVCGGELALTTCTLRHSLVEYPVVLHNGTISLQYSHWQNDTFLYHTMPWNDFQSFPLENYSWSAMLNWMDVFLTQFRFQLSIRPGEYEPTYDGDALNSNRLAMQFINGDGVRALGAAGCNTTWRDPTQYVLDRMREIAFRTAVAAANETDMNKLFFNTSHIEEGLQLIQNHTQNVQYTGHESRTLYNTNFVYVFCAIAVSLLGVVAIAPLYRGWWELGRAVSLNPLEIAKAFDAPILERVNWNATKQQISDQAVIKRVRYGAIDADGEGAVPRLNFFEEDLIRMPRSGETFR